MTIEQKHLIDIPGLPKWWQAVAIRIACYGEWYFFEGRIVQNGYTETEYPVLVVEKIKPRRIVLEDTGEVRQPKDGEYVFNNGNLCLCRKPERWGNEHQIWSVVEEE